MKLYSYSHCPFCARVKYVAGKLGIKLDDVVLDYDDTETPTKLIGKKMVPILEKDDDTVMSESNEIISLFIELAGSSESDKPTQGAIEWQGGSFAPLLQIGLPRWPLLDLTEFKTESSRIAWEDNKQSTELNFVNLIASTPEIVLQVNEFLIGTEKQLNINNGKTSLSLLDSAIYFSILRGLYCEPTITWPEQLNQWMNYQALESHVPLLR